MSATDDLELAVLIVGNALVDILIVSWVAGKRAKWEILGALQDPDIAETIVDSIVIGISQAWGRPQKRAYIQGLFREIAGGGGRGGPFKAPSIKDLFALGFGLKFGLIDPRVMGMPGGSPPPSAEGETPALPAPGARGGRLDRLRAAFGGPR